MPHTKMVALFIADLQAKRILKNPDCIEKGQLYSTIEAIKKIKSLYYDEYPLAVLLRLS